MSARWPRILVFLAVLSCIAIGPALANISDDPEPITGVGDGPDPVDPAKTVAVSEDPEPFHSGVISDTPDPISGVTKGPDPFAPSVIDDGPDPFSIFTFLAAMAISDGPDPISGIINDNPDPSFCLVDGLEPLGASIDDNPNVLRGVVTCVAKATVLVWVEQ